MIEVDGALLVLTTSRAGDQYLPKLTFGRCDKADIITNAINSNRIWMQFISELSVRDVPGSRTTPVAAPHILDHSFFAPLFPQLASSMSSPLSVNLELLDKVFFREMSPLKGIKRDFASGHCIDSTQKKCTRHGDRLFRAGSQPPLWGGDYSEFSAKNSRKSGALKRTHTHTWWMEKFACVLGKKLFPRTTGFYFVLDAPPKSACAS